MKTAGAIVALLAIMISLGTCLAADVILETPQAVDVDSSGNLVVLCQASNSIIVMTRGGEKVSEFRDGDLSNPVDMAIDSKGRILVCNTGKNEITILTPKGEKTSSIDGLNNPQAVAVGPDDSILVADSGNARVVAFARDGDEEIFEIKIIDAGDGAKALNNPTGVDYKGGTLAISDTGNRRVLLMECPAKNAESYKATAIQPFGIDPRSVALGTNGTAYFLSQNFVMGHDKNGGKTGEYRALNSQWFQPGSITMTSEGDLLIPDRTTCRVFVTDEKLTDVKCELKLDRKDPSTAVIEWESPIPQPTFVKYGTTETCEQEYRDEKPTTKHKAVIKGLKPATRYYYHAYAPVEVIPLTCKNRTDLALDIQRKSWKILAQGYSPEYAFATMPEKGMTDWVAAPTVVVVYKDVVFPPKEDGKQPEHRILSDENVQLLKSELERYRLWAWRHSSLKMSFDWTYVIVDEPRNHNELGGLGKTIFDDIYKGVTEQDKDLKDFWYVLVVGTHGWYAHYLAGTAAGTEYELGSCYTGFGPESQPGWYWFPTHEHGHLVHSWLMCSGVPTFAFPDAPWTLEGQFGENFSFLAHDYRTQPVRSWLTLKKSTIHQSVDKNGNGVPDDDPRVPLDEKRFGWNDRMGGDCLKRIMAGGRTPGYPGDTDTDFEGKKHKLNEGELYWFSRNVPQSTPSIDGKLGTSEWKEFYSIPNIATPEEQRGLKAKLYLAWDDKNYYFAVKSDKKVIAGFDLDAANDGWFHGRDNLRFTIRPELGDGRKLEVSGSIWDFLNNTIQPTGLWYTEAYKPGDIIGAAGEQDGWYVVECAVPARPDVRIAPGPGAKYGLRTYLWTDTGENQIPQTNFMDAEDFAYDLKCVPGK